MLGYDMPRVKLNMICTARFWMDSKWWDYLLKITSVDPINRSFNWFGYLCDLLAEQTFVLAVTRLLYMLGPVNTWMSDSVGWRATHVLRLFYFRTVRS